MQERNFPLFGLFGFVNWHICNYESPWSLHFQTECDVREKNSNDFPNNLANLKSFPITFI